MPTSSHDRNVSRRSVCKAALALGAVASVSAPAQAAAEEVAELEEVGAEASDESSAAAGRWLRGEYHTHTILSKDATNPYMAVANNLAAAFRDTAALERIDADHADAHIDALTDETEFDYLIFAEHLRRSLDGVESAGSDQWDTPFYQAVQKQHDFVRDLQASGSYADKTIAFACEWDMPDMDHGAVLFHTAGSDELPVEKIHEFEWKFAHASGSNANDGDDPTAMYEDGGAAELAAWGERLGDGDVEHSYEGVRWMRENFPDGFVLINHPSRHGTSGAGAVTIEKLRRLNDIAPELVFGMEGMPGNQMSWNGGRGELPETFNGCDAMIAKTGGVWDALLCEGRRFWNFTNADFHFKTSGTSYASGYWPSEFSCQHTYVVDTGSPVDDLVRGLRSGNSFSTYGNLIDALDFTASSAGSSATMGQTLEAVEGSPVTITIRFHVPAMNNYQTIGGTDTGLGAHNAPEVDHIDLIMGTVTGKVDEGAYASTANADAKIVKTFHAADFGEPDADGCYTLTYEIEAEPGTTRYFRVRGTNVAAVDENGDPLQDVDPSTGKGGVERFDYINDYNYANLCFYANPVYVTAVEDTLLPQLRDELSAAIEQGEGYAAEGYTSASFAALAQALEQGRGVLAREGATREELAAAKQVIDAAITGLVPVSSGDGGAGGSGSTDGTGSTGGTGGSDGSGTGAGPDSDSAGAGSGNDGSPLPQTGDSRLAVAVGTGLLGAVTAVLGWGSLKQSRADGE